METAIVSLVISGLIGIITVLKFISSLAAKKEASDDKFAKAEAVTAIFASVKKDISDIEDKLEVHGQKISNLQVGDAVLSSQVAAQLREVEKLGDKLDEWRNNE